MTDFWEANAENWAKVVESRTIASRAITQPAILNEISSRNARSLLDVGCGEGWLAPELAKKKIEYLGIDGSAKLIEIARDRHGPHFETASYEAITSGSWRATKNFDVALFNFSLLDENLAPVLRSVATLLSPNGTIMIQTLHPCFALKTYRDGWNVEDFKTMSVPFNGTMPWFGRTLSSWSRVFKESGLKLSAISEPTGNEGPLSIIFALVSETN
jgi:2-polyprenyl-3-methyl-5-hydroxy-6-metoxy-1,4-benzoquinol methylase